MTKEESILIDLFMSCEAENILEKTENCSDKLKELDAISHKLREKAILGLNEKGIEEFEEYDEAVFTHELEQEKEIFIVGFKLGFKIALAVKE